MLWIVMEKDSHDIIACNIAEVGDHYELWVTRPTGKSLKIKESNSIGDVLLIKEAIDYAVENGETALRL